MRASQVIFVAALIVLVSSAAPKPTQASKARSAYDYLRSVRGKSSCAGGTCAFWERQGRSFAALRCYAEQYKECVCLHRMCFSSCMFNREICNAEMVSCLKQICPRCMPVSEQAICKVYDSVAERVTKALEVFTCYSCCTNVPGFPPMNGNSNGTNNSGSKPGITTTPITNNAGISTTPIIPGAGFNQATNRPANVPGNVVSGVTGLNPGNAGGNGMNPAFSGVVPGSNVAPSNGNIRNNTNVKPNGNVNVKPATNANARPVNNANARPINNANAQPVANANAQPVANANARPNANVIANAGVNAANIPSVNQLPRQVTRPTTRPTTTTRRKVVTTAKNAVRNPAQAPKKPTSNN